MNRMTPTWQKRRSAFNHDWLKNQFMPALAKFQNLLDDRIEDVAFERSFVSSVLSQWESHREEAFALPRDFEREMSPRRLFDHPPLSRCDEQTKQWLRSLVHHLWLTRYPARQWVADATACAEEADAAYNRLQEAVGGCADIQSASALRPFREQFAEFRKRCLNLGVAIGNFLSEVRTT